MVSGFAQSFLTTSSTHLPLHDWFEEAPEPGLLVNLYKQIGMLLKTPPSLFDLLGVRGTMWLRSPSSML